MEPSMTTTTTSGRAGRAAGRTAWLTLGGVFTALTLAFGGLNVWAWLAHQTATEEHTYLHPATRIEVDVGSGDVSLAPGAAGQVSVRRHLGWWGARPRPAESWDGTTLRIRGGCPLTIAGDCYLDYQLRVPAGVTVVAHTSSGDLKARDLDGDLDLSASSGDVEVTGTRGQLAVRTSSGDVQASGLRSASVEARVSSGDVHLDFAQPPRMVRVQASAGDVDIAVPRGAYGVQADADSGDTTVAVDRSPSSPYGIVAHASSGDVRVRYGSP
jgi:Putative adhesin